MFISLAQASLSIRESSTLRHAINNANVLEKSFVHVFNCLTYGTYMSCRRT